MLTLLAAAAAGLVCGVLSGFGIGGGSLLMVWMTAVLSMEQRAAQGVNLLYFLPCAACALIFHIKISRSSGVQSGPQPLQAASAPWAARCWPRTWTRSCCGSCSAGFWFWSDCRRSFKGAETEQARWLNVVFLCRRDCRQHCGGHLSGPARPAGPRDRPDGQISSEYHRGVGRLLISPFPCISGRVHPDPPKAGLLFACRGLPAFVRDLGL